MTRRQVLAVGTVGVFLVASPVFGHHTWAVDRTREVTVTGTITGFNWSNPHVEIFLDAKDEKGNVEKWTAGGPSTGRVAGKGWDRNLLRAGDIITAVGYRATDGSRLLRVEALTLSTGQRLALYADR